MGRGGAAFPTGVKWEAVAQQPVRPHYLVCNADESEPGTFKDRVLLEGDPFALIEAMTIAAYATGCEHGYLYLRGEYPVAHARISHALAGGPPPRLTWAPTSSSTGFAFDIEIRTRRRRLHLRRGDRDLQLDRGLPGRAARQAAVPGRGGAVRQADRRQQRRDAHNVLPILLEGGPAFAQHRHREVDRDQAVLPFWARRAARRLRGRVRRRRSASCWSAPVACRAGIALQAVLLGGAAGAFVGPDQLEAAADLRGRPRGRGRRSARACDLRLRRDRRHPGRSCADRRLLPRRVLRPVHAVPRRRGAPGGGAGAAAVSGRVRGSVADELALLAELGTCMRDSSICGLGQTAPSAIASAIEHPGRVRQ